MLASEPTRRSRSHQLSAAHMRAMVSLPVGCGGGGGGRVGHAQPPDQVALSSVPYLKIGIRPEGPDAQAIKLPPFNRLRNLAPSLPAFPALCSPRLA